MMPRSWLCGLFGRWLLRSRSEQSLQRCDQRRDTNQNQLLEGEQANPQRLEESRLRSRRADDQAGHTVRGRFVFARQIVRVAMPITEVHGREKGPRLAAHGLEVVHRRDRIQHQHAATAKDPDVVVQRVLGRGSEYQILGPVHLVGRRIVRWRLGPSNQRDGFEALLPALLVGRDGALLHFLQQLGVIKPAASRSLTYPSSSYVMTMPQP